MIDIAQALYNVLHSRFGRDVRTSIHDAIYQINENANEAVQTAKAMGVGTAVSSSTSSSEGYVAGNLYLNSQTWDLWQCVGVNSWVNKGNIKGTKGDKGVDGTNNYIHIRYSQFYDGTDFTASPTASSQFMGVYYGNSATAPTNKQDYQWVSYVGAAGTSAYLHIRYSENADGSNFVSEPTANTKYIGFYAGTSSSAPANKAYYTWSKYVGNDGYGAGDMLKTEYAGKGIVGTVDKADEARIAQTAGSATTAAGLVTSNEELITADEVSAKIPTQVPTTDDKGKAPIVQEDGTVAWGTVASDFDVEGNADWLKSKVIPIITQGTIASGSDLDSDTRCRTDLIKNCTNYFKINLPNDTECLVVNYDSNKNFVSNGYWYESVNGYASGDISGAFFRLVIRCKSNTSKVVTPSDYLNAEILYNKSNVELAKELSTKLGFVKLWENSTPNAPFQVGTEIDLSSSDYDFLCFVCNLTTTSANSISLIIPKGRGAYISIATASTSLKREFQYMSDAKYLTVSGIKGTTDDATVLIPTFVYGMKF